MMRFMLAVPFAVAALLSPVWALAGEAAPACTTANAALPAEFASWAARTPLTAAASAAELPKAGLEVGKSVEATLRPTGEVAYVAQPEKPGGSVSKGGLFGLKIDRAGTYRIGFSAGPWVDVLKDGKPLVSTAHGGGPACSGIRKVVDFALEPGGYVVQVSASADPKLGVVVARRP